MNSDERASAPVTIVTGGGSGIGAAVAELLAERGQRVVVCGRRASALAAVAERTGALAVAADAATQEGVAELVERTLAAYGRIDGLVLNAGVIRTADVEELSVDDWAETLRINLTGPYLLARAALPHIRAARGSIVSVASIAALRTSPGTAAYGASKAGLIALTRSLAVDHAADGVRANCVCPGWVRTEMADEEMAEFASARGVSVDDAYVAVTELVPQRRAAEPAEIARTIAWLLSAEATYVTGATLVVDGGTVLVDAGTVPLAATPDPTPRSSA